MVYCENFNCASHYVHSFRRGVEQDSSVTAEFSYSAASSRPAQALRELKLHPNRPRYG